LPVAVEGGGRQTCQVTVPLVTFAENCTELFTRTVMGEGKGPLIETDIGVAFPPQPAITTARKITAPSPHSLMSFPPAISVRFRICAK
jgi:hypothetical protein